jgi:hypothetical protein
MNGSAVALMIVMNCTNAYLQCSGNGMCTDPVGFTNNLTNSTCYCANNYITWPAEAYPECNYAQTKRLLPFLLHLFLGPYTGVGAFMLGEVGVGVAEVVIFFFGLLPLCIYCICIEGDVDTTNPKHTCGECVKLVYILIWIFVITGIYIGVLVNIGTAVYTDKNNAPLGSW